MPAWLLAIPVGASLDDARSGLSIPGVVKRRPYQR